MKVLKARNEGEDQMPNIYIFFQLPKLNEYCLGVELAPAHQVIKKVLNGSSVGLQAVSHSMPQRLQHVIKKKNKTKRACQLLPVSSNL